MGKWKILFVLAGVLVAVVMATSLIPFSTLVPNSTTEAAMAPDVGMRPGERYHLVHVDRLQLKCDACHSKDPGDYLDPMAQVSNPVDKQACLTCHSQGSALPFYGDDWQSAKVSR